MARISSSSLTFLCCLTLVSLFVTKVESTEVFFQRGTAFTKSLSCPLPSDGGEFVVIWYRKTSTGRAQLRRDGGQTTSQAEPARVSTDDQLRLEILDSFSSRLGRLTYECVAENVASTPRIAGISRANASFAIIPLGKNTRDASALVRLSVCRTMYFCPCCVLFICRQSSLRGDCFLANFHFLIVVYWMQEARCCCGLVVSHDERFPAKVKCTGNKFLLVAFSLSNLSFVCAIFNEPANIVPCHFCLCLYCQSFLCLFCRFVCVPLCPVNLRRKPKSPQYE